MLKRVLTALVLAPAAVALVLYGPYGAVASVMSVVAAGCLVELYGMAIPDRVFERAVATVAGGAIVAGLARARAVGDEDLARGALLVAFAVPPCLVLLRPRPLEDLARRLFALWGGLVLVVVGMTSAALLAREPGNLMLVFLVVWLGDSAAYLVGKPLGRHKLYPLVSPNKSVEGAIGGLAASVAGAFIARTWLLPELPIALCAAVGLLGGIAAQVGDLTESAVKRAYGVKDSGNLLPGHGGVLDRLDAFLFTTPIAAALLGTSG